MHAGTVLSIEVIDQGINMEEQMNATEISTVLANHTQWRNGNGGKRADLRGADLRGAHGIASIPEAIGRLDEIRNHIGHGDELDMSKWHGAGWTPDSPACGTSHCLAGWAQACRPIPRSDVWTPSRPGSCCSESSRRGFGILPRKPGNGWRHAATRGVIDCWAVIGSFARLTCLALLIAQPRHRIFLSLPLDTLEEASTKGTTIVAHDATEAAKQHRELVGGWIALIKALASTGFGKIFSTPAAKAACQY